MRKAALQLASFSLATLDDNRGWSVGTPNPRRCDQNRLNGGIVALIFDFDGTLTATPGDRAERKYKIAELTERAELLKPWLQRLRDAGITLGIMSKSTEATIAAALEAAGLLELFDGPVTGKAVGLEGKAGLIEEMCVEGGPLEQLGPDVLQRVLLIDDDVRELARAGERGIQTYAAPEDGGLQEEDFREIFSGLALPLPPVAPESTEIQRAWTYGLVGQSLGLGTDPTQVDFEPGKRLVFSDHYDVALDDDLGRGSFGVIRPGVHKRTGRRCAVKFIRKDVAGRHYLETFVEKDGYTFLLKMAQEEPHPNVAKQLDYLMAGKVIYNPQELLEGEDLLAFLQEQAPITERLAMRILQQVFMALRHIHKVFQTGLIHRDVKLENLRFRQTSPRSDLVLIDFGLSCAARPAQKRTIVGTWMYMAPEVFSHYYDEKVDVWSAGVVLFIILTGKPPWVQDPSKGLSPDEAVLNGTAVQTALDMAEIKASPPLAVDFLKGLLAPPEQRPTADAALSHVWLANADKGNLKVDYLSEGPHLAAMKDTYSKTRQHSLVTPKSRRVGLTWADVGGLDDEEADEGSLSATLSPRKPFRSPGCSPGKPRRPWALHGEHVGWVSSPVGAAIPEGTSDELRDGSYAVDAPAEDPLPTLSEVLPGADAQRQDTVVDSEVKPTTCDPCCSGIISSAKWLFHSNEAKASSSRESSPG